MTPSRATLIGMAMLMACALQSCVLFEAPRPPTPHIDPPIKDIHTPSKVRDSVYLPLDRAARAPPGYGLYTVLLARAADRNTARVLSELFTVTSSAGETAMARENLNLIVIPVKSAPDAMRTLALARTQPEGTAAALMQKSYDFGQAALLMASLCHPTRGAAVMKACGSSLPEGPLLVTTLLPLDGSLAPRQRLLVVNLAATPPEALRQVLDVYRQQMLRTDFDSRVELDGWRLWALNHLLNAATMLPGLSKAYAAGP